MKMLQLPVALGWPRDYQQQRRNPRWRSSERYLISKRKRWRRQALERGQERVEGGMRERSRELNGDIIRRLPY
jgi:hypothetical protein